MKKILLVGPNIGNDENSYGGGIGGYTRNMSLYLNEFSNKDYELIPFYHSVRKKNGLKIISFPLRLFKDVINFYRSLRKNQPDGIHILALYGTALPREFCWSLLCLIFRIPYVYEIKAGMFKEECESKWSNYLMSKFIIIKASLILCEGQIYVNYIKEKFSKESYFFPNVVSLSEMPVSRKEWMIGIPTILFVGYCYKGKGVFELVEAIDKVSNKYPVKLILIGQEHPSFSDWLDKYIEAKKLNIIRMGKLPHAKVLEIMSECDIYCYPTKHVGEGHNNTINEAMMNEMIIISSKAGFLQDILKDVGYFISSVDAEEISKKIQDILNHKHRAIIKAQKGRALIKKYYNATVQKKYLYNLYNQKL